MVRDYFDLLGLPVKEVDPAALDVAYRRQRRIWFLRQYVPLYAAEARQTLPRLEEAYRMLHDPRRQAAVIRDAQAARRADDARDPGAFQPEPDPSSRESSPTGIPRPQAVRRLMAAAETMVSRLRRGLSESEKSALVRAGFQMGLDYPDAQHLVEQIHTRLMEEKKLSASS